MDLRAGPVSLRRAPREGREIAGPGAQLAATYIATEFESIGLVPAPGMAGYPWVPAPQVVDHTRIRQPFVTTRTARMTNRLAIYD